MNSLQVTESEWSLVFSDEFKGNKLDSKYWSSTNEISEKRSNKIML
jgi:hypothetical protein